MDREGIDRLEKEFDNFYRSSEVLAILLFGSKAGNDSNIRSDTDICIVKGSNEGKNEEILQKIWSEVGGKYDIWLFEELEINVQSTLVDNYQIILCDDPSELGEYLYGFRKRINTYRHRLKVAYGKL